MVCLVISIPWIIFILIDKNDFKNLENIFKKCNLRIKKFCLKVLWKYISKWKNLSLDSFYFVEIESDYSKIFYFEDNCLKFEQYFKFGYDIILKDISKITLLKTKTIKEILSQTDYRDFILETELVEKNFLKMIILRKLKKLIFDIAEQE